MIRYVAIVSGLVVLAAFVALEWFVETLERRPDPIAGGWAHE